MTTDWKCQSKGLRLFHWTQEKIEKHFTPSTEMTDMESKGNEIKNNKIPETENPVSITKYSGTQIEKFSLNWRKEQIWPQYSPKPCSKPEGNGVKLSKKTRERVWPKNSTPVVMVFSSVRATGRNSQTGLSSQLQHLPALMNRKV